MPYNGPGLSLVLVSSSWVRSKRRLFTLAICRLAIFHSPLRENVSPTKQSRCGQNYQSRSSLKRDQFIFHQSKSFMFCAPVRKLFWRESTFLESDHFYKFDWKGHCAPKITRSDSPKKSHLTCFIQSDKVIAACLAMKLINDIGLNG